MIEQQKCLAAYTNSKTGQDVKALSRTDHNFGFQRQMLKNLRARSEANQLRLQNEVNFVRQIIRSIADIADTGQAFNVAAQNQSETLLSINIGTKDDGAAMRAVAIVTLTFLPATFVSASLK